LTSLLIIGDDSETGAIDLQVNFKGIDDTIKESLNAFLNTYGLTADSFSALEVSGKALEIKNRALKEIREDQIEIFRQSEKELFNLIRIVNNYHSKSQISDKLEFKIDYAEMEIHDDPESKRKTADHDLEKGLISPAQYYMIFNPDIKDAENAEKILKENLEKNKELKDAGYSLNDEINNE
jgi:predicted ribosome quality control (RQC) complex YloA/Tae2 family protein